MRSSFFYSETTVANSVNFYLFASQDGTARANVKGPARPHFDGHGEIVDAMMSLPLAKAFAYAIRVANRNDVEIVVSGDPSLWDHRWGWLDKRA